MGLTMSEKKVIVDLKNPEGEMHLITKGKNATENALKIMKAFDDACTEIKEKEAIDHE